MRCLNCARNKEEENLVALEVKGSLYYRYCNKNIKISETVRDFLKNLTATYRPIKFLATDICTPLKGL